MTPVLDACNNSPHTATKIATNKANENIKYQVLINIIKEQKKSNYPKLEIGANVRVPVNLGRYS